MAEVNNFLGVLSACLDHCFLRDDLERQAAEEREKEANAAAAEAGACECKQTSVTSRWKDDVMRCRSRRRSWQLVGESHRNCDVTHERRDVSVDEQTLDDECGLQD